MAVENKIYILIFCVFLIVETSVEKVAKPNVINKQVSLTDKVRQGGYFDVYLTRFNLNVAV